MTVLLSYLSDEFSIVAADNRRTFNNPAAYGGNKFGDDANKLFSTPLGWAVGSGTNITNDAFEYIVNDIRIETKSDIWKAFLHASKKADKIDKKSCLMHFFLSMNYWSEGSTHLEVCSLDFMHNMRNLKNRNILILNPPKYTTRIKRLNDEFKAKTAGIKNLNEIIYHIADYMQKLAKLSDLVSSNVSCGISLRISEYEIILRRIDASAKEIKRLYKKTGDLSDLMTIERIKTKESVENVGIQG